MGEGASFYSEYNLLEKQFKQILLYICPIVNI